MITNSDLHIIQIHSVVILTSGIVSCKGLDEPLFQTQTQLSYWQPCSSCMYHSSGIGFDTKPCLKARIHIKSYMRILLVGSQNTYLGQ